MRHEVARDAVVGVIQQDFHTGFGDSAKHGFARGATVKRTSGRQDGRISRRYDLGRISVGMYLSAQYTVRRHTSSNTLGRSSAELGTYYFGVRKRAFEE